MGRCLINFVFCLLGDNRFGPQNLVPHFMLFLCSDNVRVYIPLHLLSVILIFIQMHLNSGNMFVIELIFKKYYQTVVVGLHCISDNKVSLIRSHSLNLFTLPILDFPYIFHMYLTCNFPCFLLSLLDDSSLYLA